jgi:ATP-dependent DNA helicase DinG
MTEANSPLDVLGRAVAALGGEDRPGQRELCAAVAEAMVAGHHLVAEAPTGSGKSLAYLAPAVTTGRRVVVATATLTLQDQLWHKDLPHLRATGGVPFEAALLKGRSQYVCLAKLRNARDGGALFDERPGPTLARDLDRISALALASPTGDLGEVDVADPSRRAVSCAPRECPGAAKCSDGDQCFAERARRRAAEADVLVVNHALYCAHLASGGNVLPDHDVVVFDEAHGVADVATDALGLDVSPLGLRQLASRLVAVGVGRSDADLVADAADALERALDASDGRVDPSDGAVGDALLAAAERLTTARRGIDGATDADAAAQVTQLVATRLDALRRMREPAAGEVVWREGPTLRLAPIDVSGALAERLFGAVPAVLLSATLGGDAPFAAFTRRLGLDPTTGPGPVDVEGPDGEPAVAPGLGYVPLRVGSPFDFPNQAILYVARHLPEPRDPAWPTAATAEITGLVEAAGGRALVLCTSRAAVTRVSAALRDETDHPVLVQGEGGKAALLERFAAEEASVLVATRSFWMGVDVPGPACVLVVIDRLPFTRPDDPLAQARRADAERRGGSGFQDVDLPAAALVLAQGVGRLIRSTTDRGVVAVLDRRLATAGYRRVLLDGLPPMRRVVDPEVVRAFLADAAGDQSR